MRGDDLSSDAIALVLALSPGGAGAMTPELPLAAAQARLGKPGRPRKASPAPHESALTGHSSGTAASPTRVNGGAEPSALAYRAIAPRLLDLPQAAAYLAVSPWTARALEATGVLMRVRVPLPNGGELRKVLFDVRDLDRLIEAWKDGAEAGRKPGS